MRAQHVRRKAVPRQLIAVTGTNGKTSTTHLIAHALSRSDEPVLLESTLGYFLDRDPLDVLRGSSGFAAALAYATERGARAACVEVTSSALARGFAKAWPFDVAVLTNVTRDHLDVHGSQEAYELAKFRLFESLRPGAAAVLNANDRAAVCFASRLPSGVTPRFFSVASRGPQLFEACLTARHVHVSWEGTVVELERSDAADELGGAFELRLTGEVFAENGLAAALAALSAGASGSTIRTRFGELPPPPGRFQVVGRRPYVVIDFAHTPDAIARTASTARRLAGSSRVTLVFGAGGGRDVGKRRLMGEAASLGADRLVITTDNPRHEDPVKIASQIAEGAHSVGRAEVSIELDRRRAIAQALDDAGQDDVVVIAGRGPEVEQIFAQHRVAFSDEQVALSLLGERP